MINTIAYIITEQERYQLMDAVHSGIMFHFLRTLEPGRVIDGHKLLKDTLSADRDFEGDKGQRGYIDINTCEHCGRWFSGLSSRTTCRACTTKDVK